MATFLEISGHEHRHRGTAPHRRWAAAGEDEATWVLTSYLVANAIGPALSGWPAGDRGRPQGLLHGLRGALQPRLAPVRNDPEPRLAGGGADSRGTGRRRSHPERADHPRRRPSGPTPGPGLRDLRRGRGRRASDRPHARRLHQRPVQLALDLLHQRPDRIAVSPPDLAARLRPRISSDCARPGSAKGSGWTTWDSAWWRSVSEPSRWSWTRASARTGSDSRFIVFFATVTVVALAAAVRREHRATEAGLVLSLGVLTVMALMPVVGALVSRAQARWLSSP